MNRGPERNMGWALAKDKVQQLGIHASETAWMGIQFDLVLDNNGSLDQLYKQINDLLRDLRASKASPLE
jgi:dephospho-CoA kinase